MEQKCRCTNEDGNCLNKTVMSGGKVSLNDACRNALLVYIRYVLELDAQSSTKKRKHSKCVTPHCTVYLKENDHYLIRCHTSVAQYLEDKYPSESCSFSTYDQYSSNFIRQKVAANNNTKGHGKFQVTSQKVCMEYPAKDQQCK